MTVECPKPVNLPYPAPLEEAIQEKIYKKHVLKIDDQVGSNQTVT